MEEMFTKMFGGLTGIFDIVLQVAVWLILAGGVISIFIWMYVRKQNNIPILIHSPRSDGKLINEFLGRGRIKIFRSGAKVLKFKRKGKRGNIIISAPSPHFFVSPSNNLHLVQTGVNSYEPVHPDSYTTIYNDDKPVSLIKFKAKNDKAGTFGNLVERRLKDTFTIQTFFQQYKEIFFLVALMIGFGVSIYLIYTQLGAIVVQLGRFVDKLSV